MDELDRIAESANYVIDHFGVGDEIETPATVYMVLLRCIVEVLIYIARQITPSRSLLSKDEVQR